MCLFLSIAGVVSAQRLVSLQPERAIELALQNNETVKKAEKVVERAKATSASPKPFTSRRLDSPANIKDRKMATSKTETISLAHKRVCSWHNSVKSRKVLMPHRKRSAKPKLNTNAPRRRSSTLSEISGIIFILTQEEIKERGAIAVELEKKLEGTKIEQTQRRIPFLRQLNTELELSEQQLALNELQRQLDVDTAELISLTGLDPLAQVVLSRPLPDDDVTLDAAVELAIANSLDLRDLQGDMLRQERLAGETIWNHFPELSAEARYKDLSVLLEQQAGNQTWDAKAIYDPVILDRERDGASLFETNPRTQDGWELGFRFNIPLYDGNKTKNLRSREVAELERMQLEYVEQTKLIRVEVRRDYREVANAKERMEIEEKRVRIFEQQLRTIERVLDEVTVEIPGYQGLTYNDAFQAQAQFTEAQRVYYQTRRDHARAKEKLRETMQWIE